MRGAARARQHHTSKGTISDDVLMLPETVVGPKSCGAPTWSSRRHARLAKTVGVREMPYSCHPRPVLTTASVSHAHLLICDPEEDRSRRSGGHLPCRALKLLPSLESAQARHPAVVIDEYGGTDGITGRQYVSRSLSAKLSATNTIYLEEKGGNWKRTASVERWPTSRRYDD